MTNHLENIVISQRLNNLETNVLLITNKMNSMDDAISQLYKHLKITYKPQSTPNDTCSVFNPILPSSAGVGGAVVGIPYPVPPPPARVRMSSSRSYNTSESQLPVKNGYTIVELTGVRRKYKEIISRKRGEDTVNWAKDNSCFYDDENVKYFLRFCPNGGYGEFSWNKWFCIGVSVHGKIAENKNDFQRRIALGIVDLDSGMVKNVTKKNFTFNSTSTQCWFYKFIHLDTLFGKKRNFVSEFVHRSNDGTCKIAVKIMTNTEMDDDSDNVNDEDEEENDFSDDDSD